MVACANHQIKLSEYSAREVNQSVVGYGAAQKQQVKHMVVSILMLNALPQNDASDALAIAICHSHRRLGLSTKKKNTRRLTYDWLAQGRVRDKQAPGKCVIDVHGEGTMLKYCMAHSLLYKKNH